MPRTKESEEVKDRIKARHYGAEHIAQRLVRPHHIEIVVGCQRKRRHDVVEHPAMLTGHADARLDSFRVCKSKHQRRHLYGLRTRAENTENAHESITAKLMTLRAT